VIIASFVVLALAALCFFVRFVVGPSLPDRIVAIDGMLVVGVSAIGVEAVRSGIGSFLPAALVVTLVGFLSTAVAARFLAERDS
jgi:multicomponent Na+:H+ antiporter subunit F